MKLVKATTKRGQAMLETHERAKATYLTQLYVCPSGAKMNAFDYCMHLCAKLDGYDFKAHSANCFQFSASFKTADGLVYITKYYDYIVC